MTDVEATEHYRILCILLRWRTWWLGNEYENVLQEAMIFLIKHGDPMPQGDEYYGLRATIYVRAIWNGCRVVFGEKHHKYGRRARRNRTGRWNPADMDDAFPARRAQPVDRPIMYSSMRCAMRNLDARDRAALCLAADGMMSTYASRYLGVSRQAAHMQLRQARLRAKAAWPDRDFVENAACAPGLRGVG